MERSIRLVILFIVMINTGCEKDESHIECLEVTCEDEETKEIYSNESGVIRELVIGHNPNGESYDFIPENPSGKVEPYSLFVILAKDNELLIPCQNLLGSFMDDSMAVTFSGTRIACCNLLTQPNVRTSFGCKFEITSIELLSDK